MHLLYEFRFNEKRQKRQKKIHQLEGQLSDQKN